jgi:hypothetical protein
MGVPSLECGSRAPILASDVKRASEAALSQLDEGFFRVRFERLTPKEREYVVAMASWGQGPYKSSYVALALGVWGRAGPASLPRG